MAEKMPAQTKPQPMKPGHTMPTMPHPNSPGVGNDKSMNPDTEGGGDKGDKGSEAGNK